MERVRLRTESASAGHGGWQCLNERQLPSALSRHRAGPRRKFVVPTDHGSRAGGREGCCRHHGALGLERGRLRQHGRGRRAPPPPPRGREGELASATRWGRGRPRGVVPTTETWDSHRWGRGSSTRGDRELEREDGWVGRPLARRPQRRSSSGGGRGGPSFSGAGTPARSRLPIDNILAECATSRPAVGAMVKASILI